MSVELYIASENVDTNAWWCLNKDEVIDLAAPQEIENERLAETNGAQAYEGFDGEARVDLAWVITGNVHPDTGEPHTTPEAGLAINKRLFKERYFRAERDDDGCVDCTGTDAAGVTSSNPIQVEAPRFEGDQFEAGIVMTVRVPAGELAVVSS